MKLWKVAIVCAAGGIIGCVVLLSGFVFGLCGSMEPATACSGYSATESIGILLITFSLIGGLAYFFPRGRSALRRGTL